MLEVWHDPCSREGPCHLLPRDAAGSSASRTLPRWPVHHHAGLLVPCMLRSGLSCPASGPGHRRAQHPPVVPQSSPPRPPQAPRALRPAPVLSSRCRLPVLHVHGVVGNWTMERGATAACRRAPAWPWAPTLVTGQDGAGGTPRSGLGPFIKPPTLGSPGPVVRASTF